MWFTRTFTPGGRIGRIHYVMAGIVGFCIVTLPVAFLLTVATVFGPDVSGGMLTSMTFAIAVLMLVATYLYAVVVVMSKRLHDLGRSGWHCAWILVAWVLSSGSVETGAGIVGSLLTIVSTGVGLYLVFAPGQTGENRFGPAPI